MPPTKDLIPILDLLFTIITYDQTSEPPFFMIKFLHRKEKELYSKLNYMYPGSILKLQQKETRTRKQQQITDQVTKSKSAKGVLFHQPRSREDQRYQKQVHDSHGWD